MRGSEADLVTTAIVAASRFPFPQSLQKSGNCYGEAHRLSRFRDHRTACSCLKASSAFALYVKEQCSTFLPPRYEHPNVRMLDREAERCCRRSDCGPRHEIVCRAV